MPDNVNLITVMRKILITEKNDIKRSENVRKNSMKLNMWNGSHKIFFYYFLSCG